MRYVEQPNLPQRDVRLAAVSCTYPQVLRSLNSLGIQAVAIQPSRSLDLSVQSHADMLCHHLGGNKLVVARGERKLKTRLEKLGLQVFDSEKSVEKPYPNDISLNVLRVGNFAFMGRQARDKTIRAFCKDQGIEVVEVRQGYARCSAAVVDDGSFITADHGMYRAGIRAGLDVLLIRPGFIRLEEYPYGFIGGCCGKLGKNKIGFAGELRSHPDYEAMCDFLSRKQVEIVTLMDGLLTDIGGILPLMEDGSNNLEG